MKMFVRTMLVSAAAFGPLAAGASGQSFAGAEQPASLAGFGGSIAFAGDQLLVAEAENQLRPGRVYVYARDGMGAWTEVQRIEGADADLGDGFSAAMAVTGSSLFVSGSSGVETFERGADGTWSPTGMLPAPMDLAPEAGFGVSLAVNGDILLVGAPGAAGGTGAVYVYRRGADGWAADGTVPVQGIQSGDVFGLAMAFDGSRLLVGAPGQRQGAGVVHAFAWDGAAFSTTGSLGSRRVAPGTGMGGSLALNGDLALVGAPALNQGTGGVMLFRIDEDGDWNQVGRLAAFDGGPGTSFGSGMAVVDGQIWIGGPGNNAAYVFETGMDGEIVSARKMSPEGAGGRGGRSMGIAASGSMVAAGFPGSGDGEVLVYDRDGGDWSVAGSMEAEVEELAAVAGGEVSCEEGEAVVWDCSDVDLVSFVPVSTLAGEPGVRVNTNDNWGWQDPETGRYYALVGMSDRASFVDITDAEDPVVVGILHMTEGARPSAWRDIKTYEDHAFIVSDGAGQHGMQVFDLTRLRDFDGGEPIVFDADALYTDIASAHNIVINEDTGYAFSVGSSSGGETCGGGLHIISIQEPTAPTFAGCFSDPQTGRSGTGYTHDAQCVTYDGPDADYQGREVCFGANETALSIADVTNKESTIAISNAAYPHVGYSHQGWLTEDHRFFFMNDELDEIAYWNDPEAMEGGASKTRTLIWDVTDLDDPQLVAEHLGVEESSDHNLYVVGDLMYQSNYRSGLRILDISDPAAPVEVAYFDTVPYGDNSAGMGGSWSNYPFFDTGMVIVTSGSEGLFVVRPTIRRTVF